MSKEMINNLKFEELTKLMADMGEPQYRALQIFEGIHKRQNENYEQISGIGKGLIEKLRPYYGIGHLKLAKQQVSKDAHTEKYLFEAQDGALIESVLMKYRHGYAVCVSTQVGCAMNCSFCTSGEGGKVRNLMAFEMLEQIYQIQKFGQIKISNIVLMGMGEPLDNYDEVLRFIRLINEEKGQNIGIRHITLSTCGLVPKIMKLAEENLGLTLSISLHAITDEKRKKLMPIAKRYAVDSLLEACRYYIEKTNRRITFEYIMIDGLNDTMQDAQMLCEKLSGMLCHINLIPMNPNANSKWQSSKEAQIIKFKNMLEKNKFQVTLRREMGTDIDAACGQLRKKYLKE